MEYPLAYLIISLYTLALLLVFFYSLAQLNLLFNYLKHKKKGTHGPLIDLSKKELVPYVTIQLPIYNEAYVVERLFENIAFMEYPKDRLEIQVLDDSTDASVEKTASLIKGLQDKGLDIVHVRRTNREGYKAGALKEGLAIAKGSLIAIFDADFLPQKDWLLQTVPHFGSEEIGVVQTRWGHINRDYSILTRI